MKRCDGRKVNELRKIKITKDYLSHPLSSVLIEFGGTKVICSVSLQKSVPPWMRAQKVPGGWVTSEYGMLPASTHDRVSREAARGKQSGRTMEIQRLIGRSFRSVIDLQALGPNTVYIDCDVIDADGGTRCASITGASIALEMAFKKLVKKKIIKKNPMREKVAAISIGMFNDEAILDLCYTEDSTADVDMNFIMTDSGKFIEIQGTAEEKPFSYDQMQGMIKLAQQGINQIFQIENKYLESIKPKQKRNHKTPIATIGDVLDQV